MDRFLEFILGLQPGFLSRQGHLSLQFNPTWPLQDYVGGAAVWNTLLTLAALALVVYVYRKDGRSKSVKITLGIIRGLLLAFVLILLNRPVLTLGQVRREPSVVALLIDDSISMKVPDMSVNGKPASRLDAVAKMLTTEDAKTLRELAAVHNVHIYDFSRGRQEIASIAGPVDTTSTGTSASGAATQPSSASIDSAVAALQALKPAGDGTQVVSSVRSVLEDLQGQRLAGVVVFTDGRETPTAALPDAVAAIKSFGVNIYPVPMGTEKMPKNISVNAVSYEPSAFVDDLTNFKVTVQATGYEANHPITLALEREVTANGQTTRIPVKNAAGQDITQTVTAIDDKPFDVDLQFKPTTADMPTANLVVDAKPQEGELDLDDNVRKVQLAVLDDNVSMLYVDGYPRWDYRYLKTAMLRDKTVKISCLLTSADPSFDQEGSTDKTRPSGTWAIKEFPTSIEQLLDYDVIVFGDVDPRQFTDTQLQLVSDFVSKKGGGFAMVAGPRWSPQSYRNTPIEPILPVIITHTETDDNKTAITQGFRPVLTKAGQESSIFRFYPDKAVNDEFIKDKLQDVFWYCRGAIAKPGVGIVYAEHPTDLGPDNRKAPILVVGQFGAGRTIFSAVDDSWRWRYYTGESVFNTYWVQQLRYLARGKKLGQRKITFTVDREVYELGQQMTVNVRVLSPELMQQLSPPVSVDIVDDATNQTVRRLDLDRQEGSPDLFTGSLTMDRVGSFTANLSHVTNEPMAVSYKVLTPKLELVNPTVDVPALSRIATDAPITFSDAGSKLASMIHSAARTIPVPSSQPLWNAPLAMIIFMILITSEWLLRKMFGML
jgi:uncharacterized membrane protein